MFLLLQCGQAIPPFSCSEIVRIFENAFLQALVANRDARAGLTLFHAAD
jgi:hypothetical protein